MTQQMESLVERASKCRRFARFFLSEPDSRQLDMFRIDSERQLDSSPELRQLRIEFTRLFLLNVYPYASIYLDGAALLNTETTARVESIYADAGFEPDPILGVGAPDHFALELLFTAHLLESDRERQANDFVWHEILPWALVFLYSVEKNSPESYYHQAAQETYNWLVKIPQPIDGSERELPNSMHETEDDLESVVSHLLTPAVSGMWLSKQDISALGRELALPLGFGDRGLMLKGLFRASGEYGRVDSLLAALLSEVDIWLGHYAREMQTRVQIAPILEIWLTRAHRTRARLEHMIQLVRSNA